MKTGSIHFAKLDKSPRLQRVLSCLRVSPQTTRDLVFNADVCAVNTAIQELRMNGYNITCTPIAKGVYKYELIG